MKYAFASGMKNGGAEMYPLAIGGGKVAAGCMFALPVGYVHACYNFLESSCPGGNTLSNFDPS